jgi:serine/threonine protein kinase
MVGKTLSHYRIEAVLGDGGMGTVYRAHDERLNRPVALKMLHPHLARDQQLVERFRNEARIQASLIHPNIVSIFDFVQEGEMCAIVMEYIEGVMFSELLAQQGGPLPWKQVLELFTPLLQALDLAHSRGIIHRDLKPENLILQNSYGVKAPKIMDFGIARALGDAKRQTATGVKMGTLAYMSPEQCRADKDITHLTDIYSIAATMYEMLAGRAPFDEDSEYALMNAIIQRPPTPLRRLNPAVPEWFERALMQAMAKDPHYRFASAKLLAEDLAGHDAPPLVIPPTRQPSPQPPPPVRPPLTPSPPSPGVKRNWVILGVTGSLVLVALVVLVFAVVHKKSSVDPAGVPSPPPPLSASPAPPNEAPEINAVLNQWQSAWEGIAGGSNLDTYMSFYADDFAGFNEGRRMTKAQWRADKADKYAKKTAVRVSIIDPQITMINSGEANVTFIQDFHSTNHSDYGRKELRLQKLNGRWLITYENWREVRR